MQTSGASQRDARIILSVMPKSPTLDSLSIATGQRSVPIVHALATEIRRQFVFRSFACYLNHSLGQRAGGFRPPGVAFVHRYAGLFRYAGYSCSACRHPKPLPTFGRHANLKPAKRLEFMQHRCIARRNIGEFGVLPDIGRYSAMNARI